MPNFEWDCPSCKLQWNIQQEEGVKQYETVECPKCGRISQVLKIVTRLKVTPTKAVAKPTQYEQNKKKMEGKK